jgi:hypothetical protein
MSEIPVKTREEATKDLFPEVDQPVSEQTKDPVNDRAWEVQDMKYTHLDGWPT